MVDHVREKGLMSLSPAEAFFVYRGLEAATRSSQGFKGPDKTSRADAYSLTKGFVEAQRNARLDGTYANNAERFANLLMQESLAKAALYGVQTCVEQVLQPKLVISMDNDLASQERRIRDLEQAYRAINDLAEIQMDTGGTARSLE